MLVGPGVACPLEGNVVSPQVVVNGVVHALESGYFPAIDDLRILVRDEWERRAVVGRIRVAALAFLREHRLHLAPRGLPRRRANAVRFRTARDGTCHRT